MLLTAARAFFTPTFMRYALVGLASNGVLYLVYLLLVGLSLGPKTAATLTYAVGVMQTFWANRSWSFTHDGDARQAFRRYVTVYFIGYLINMLALYLFVDRLGLDHRWVQAALVLGLAALIFLSLRFWAFRPETSVP